ncbi:cyclin-dependent protein kinase [Nowakowskiella sp. JEL0407]|nr:cyclin-dependent protein kinase [Nowakowskiella sp. JEL0407]
MANSKTSKQFEDFRKKKKADRKDVDDKYNILGFISAGTYGKVFKATSKDPSRSTEIFAIKKFKPEKEGEMSFETGMSQSACREIALCRELSHPNIVKLEEVILNPIERSISMIFEFAEHDLLQILHHHGQTKTSIPEITIKSVLWQLLNGLAYLSANWILHRDLKPANILVTSNGIVKIADLGLARIYQKPLQSLYKGDKVVVTIWYRAPELLLGTQHYTKAIDMWAVGCIFAELIKVQPIFDGKEVRPDSKNVKLIPYQNHQVEKIFGILGTPSGKIVVFMCVDALKFDKVEKWPELKYLPEYSKIPRKEHLNRLRDLFSRNKTMYISENSFDLLSLMLLYNPDHRISAEAALKHPYFEDDPMPKENVLEFEYPLRKVVVEPSPSGSSTKSKR